VEEKHNVSRSFCSGSVSLAISMGISSDDIDEDVINRWSRKEKAGGARPSHWMRHHYADVSLLLDSFLRYTGAM
jgi:hypothetical protein